MNLGYMHRRIVSMNYRGRIVSLAWASTNLFEKPRKGYRLCMINARPLCSEVKIGRQLSPTSAKGSSFSKRMKRVPYASKPLQTRINMSYSNLRSKKPIKYNPNAVRLVRTGPRWKKRLARPAAYFERFDLKYLNSLRTTHRSRRTNRTSSHIKTT